MKKLLLLSTALLASGLSMAQEVGSVISATPIVQQVNSPGQGRTIEPVAYNVIYEFGGKQYSVQMPTDPGPTVQLQISPVGSSAQAAQAPANATYVQPAYEQPDYVVMAPPVYPAYHQPGYYQPNYIVPFALGLGFGYWGGYGGHGHGHWR